MDKLFNIVENGKPSVNFYIHSDCEKTVINGVNDVVKSIKLISGADISVHEITSEQITSFVGAVVFGTFDDFPALKFLFKDDFDALLDTDGFAVRAYGGNCFIFAHDSAGVFYGANDFLESGADIVWSRGYGKEYEQLIKSKILISLLSDDILITYDVTSNNYFIDHAIYYYIFILGLTSYIRPYIRVNMVVSVILKMSK